MHNFSQPKDNFLPPELTIETFFILEVSSLYSCSYTEMAVQWLRLALSNGPNRASVSHPSPAYLLVPAKIISSTLKMEAIYSSETSVETQQTTRRHITEHDTLHNHRCENLKSYKTDPVSEMLCSFVCVFLKNADDGQSPKT
jgi:hypothetical protein